MAIPQSEIHGARSSTALYSRYLNASNSLYESSSRSKETAFLCHSHKDKELAERVEAYLLSKGWNVYIDWKDNSMPEKPSRDTATKIQERIKKCDWFLFLATANSMTSRWCPWEIGFSDGIKGKDWIIVIPTSDASGISYGSEYMELYRRIDYTLESVPTLKRIEPGYSYSGTALSSI